MKKRLLATFLAALLGGTLLGVSSAEAAPSTPTATAKSYANCDALHKQWQYGVAKSRKAARKQVRTGHYKPHVSLAGYRANSNLDADKDGTACEVLK
jgi:hypothetical protein